MVQIPCVIPSISREFNANYPNSQCDKTNITRHAPANYKLIAYIWTSTMRPQLSLIIDVPSINSNNLVDPPLVFSLFHRIRTIPSPISFILEHFSHSTSPISPVSSLSFFFLLVHRVAPFLELYVSISVHETQFSPLLLILDFSPHKFELNRIYLAYNSCPNLCSFRSTEK